MTNSLAFGLEFNTEKYFTREDFATANDAHGVRAWMREHGLDYTVSTHNNPNRFTGEPTKFFDIYRDDTQQILGSGVTKRFVTIQNSESSEILCDFAKDANGNAIMARGMTFDGGRVAVAQMDLGAMTIGDTGRGGFKDEVRKFVTFANAHDGSGKMRVFTTPTRIVCANTLTHAISAAHDGFAISHTKSAEARLKEARKAFKIINKELIRAEAVYQELAKKTMTQDAISEFLLSVFPLDKADGKAAQQNAKDAIANVMRLINDADGGRIDPRTGWNVYNAANKYLVHSSPVRSHNKRDDDEVRTQSVLMGSIAEKNGLALKNAIRYAEVDTDEIDRILMAVETSQAAQLAVYATEPVNAGSIDLFSIGVGV